jgi:hypothetical protein
MSHTQVVVIVFQVILKGCVKLPAISAIEFVITIQPPQSVVISQYTLKAGFVSGFIK